MPRNAATSAVAAKSGSGLTSCERTSYDLEDLSAKRQLLRSANIRAICAKEKRSVLFVQLSMSRLRSRMQ